MTPISARALAQLHVPYDRLDAATRQELKYRLLDAVLATLGGTMVTPAAELSAARAATPGEGATRPVCPTGVQTSPEAAAFLNGFLIRQADWGDSYVTEGVVSGHPSDLVAAVLALCDAPDVPGTRVLELVHLAYRLWAAFRAGIPGLSPAGWDYTTLHALCVPVLAAVRHGDDLARLNNAVRLSASGGGIAAQIRAGDVTNWKSGASGYALARAIWSYHLSGVFETAESLIAGPRGWNKLIAPVNEDVLEAGVDDASQVFGRLNVKQYPCFQVAQSPVACAIRLHGDLPGQVQGIERVRVTVSDKNARIANRPGRPVHPDNHSAADHHVPYCVAVALRFGTLTPLHFEDEHLDSPDLRHLVERTEVLSFGEDSAEGGEACRVDVTLAGDRTLSESIDVSPGSVVGLSTADRLATLREVLATKRGVVESAWACDLGGLVETLDRLEERDGRAVLTALHEAIAGVPGVQAEPEPAAALAH